jgi:hypothetical protein
MFEGALFGLALLVILGAPMGVLNWLFDRGRAVVSTLIVALSCFGYGGRNGLGTCLCSWPRNFGRPSRARPAPSQHLGQVRA